MVEILVVIAIIAVLAALLFPVFASTKESAKASDCLSQQFQLLAATSIYIGDSDGVYPQTKPTSNHPEIDDRGGNWEEPDSGPYWPIISPYLGGSHQILSCPSDPDPSGKDCLAENPDSPDVTSYLVNAFFAFGLRDSAVSSPASTIYLAERRSEGPYCDYLYRPWYSRENPEAREDQMDANIGAIATHRHNGKSNFGFADGHARSFAFDQTFSAERGLSYHNP